jgi:hypothetical protein
MSLADIYQYGRSLLCLEDDHVIISAVLMFQNIPYSYTRSAFLEMMKVMKLPLPFAFNYYYREGKFKA